MSFFRDPLVRRFLSGSVFASAFVWVAVRFFDVDPEVVKVLFILSVVFVIGMILIGLCLSVFIRMWRRRSNGGMLDHLDLPQDHHDDKSA